MTRRRAPYLPARSIAKSTAFSAVSEPSVPTATVLIILFLRGGWRGYARHKRPHGASNCLPGSGRRARVGGADEHGQLGRLGRLRGDRAHDAGRRDRALSPPLSDEEADVHPPLRPAGALRISIVRSPVSGSGTPGP